MEMEKNNAVEYWQELFSKYRGTEKSVLYLEALRIGLRQGEITSDDLSHIEVINRKVVGAVVKGLAQAGMFERVGYTKSKLESAHSRIIGVWILKKPSTAHLIIDSVCASIDGARIGNGKEQQLELC